MNKEKHVPNNVPYRILSMKYEVNWMVAYKTDAKRANSQCHLNT